MSRTVEILHDYPVAPERLWDVVTDFSLFQQAMKGVAAFDGLPEGRVEEGQRIEVMVSLFGVLPRRPYVMRVVACDHPARRLVSEEDGMGVRLWRHAMSVEEAPGGARLVDRVEVDAGSLTWAYSAFARFVYRARHRPRLRLLGLA